MKLVDALRIANAPQAGPPFNVLFACGFTPLYLEVALKAHFRLRLPDRSIILRTGAYGDIAGTLGKNYGHLDAVVAGIEWSDLDPRIGWRTMGQIAQEAISDARMRLSLIAQAIDAVAAQTPTAVALPILPVPPVFHTHSRELNRIEASLRELIYGFAATTSAVVVQPENVRLPDGHDLRSEMLSGFPYGFAQAEVLARSLVETILPPMPAKGLITDLDETLWSGILGDDGPRGIFWDLEHKAQFHALYQTLLNAFAERGTLVAVASKNSVDLVQEAFQRPDLAVKPEIFFPLEVHWGPKAESVERILRAWNIGPESVVFVDDNLLELEQIKQAFPAMECVEFRKDDPTLLVRLQDRFSKRRILEEDRLRATSLRNGQILHDPSSGGANLETLLAGAKARMTFHWAKNAASPRALELVNKTNQFNLNGRRYSESDWSVWLGDPATCLAVVEYEDRFGKLGRIAVLGGKEIGTRFEVEVWVMSCRAFSRRIEYQCLKMLLDRWETVTLQYGKTERNGPLQEFLTSVCGGSNQITRSEFAERCPPLSHSTESFDE